MKLILAALLLAGCTTSRSGPVNPAPSETASAALGVGSPGLGQTEASSTRATPQSGQSERPLASLGGTSRPGSGLLTPVPATTLTGLASWYRYAEGQAAAGPRLRAALGPGWRGDSVKVCAAICIMVRLTDYCGCPGGRIIDLDYRDFMLLVRLSQGLTTVTVRRD